ncbi:MAG: endopeptidase La [Bacteroidia bacterium]|nr:endopeptidase La [Bacteroidia bacterium]MDW8134240.1 endopeptidase La [Bacteroidia bacterium]
MKEENNPFAEDTDSLSYALRATGALQFPPVDLPELAVLPLRNTLLFPGVILPISVARPSSIRLLESLKSQKISYLAIVAQKNPQKDEVSLEDIYTTATLAKILKAQTMPDGHITLLIQGRHRIRLQEFTQVEPFMKARYVYAPEILPDETHQKGLLIALRENALRALELLPESPQEARTLLQNIQGLHFMTNFLANNLPMELPERQSLLEIDEIAVRAEKVLAQLQNQLNILEVTEDILNRVRSSLEKQQRDYILRQQIKAIQDELGESPEQSDISRYREAAKNKKWTAEAQKAFEREIARLERIPPFSPEYGVSTAYIEWLLELPWQVYSKDRFNITKARGILEKDHYGMEKVKKRVLEYLAVLKLRRDMRSPILCLYGPPGVGKTSLARSIAEALGRKYVRMSLGGLHDEAEIRGHRRTYIGAMPGRILQLLRRAGTSNPVFVLDEIDKIGRDLRGDPAYALLEVLDPEQNSTFQDHYLEIPYDLSHVLFIATANTLETIHPALRDRMEIIELSGYSVPEKVQIARRHLIPKVANEHGLPASRWHLPEDTVVHVIERYTRESGVRQLQRELAGLARWSALKIVENKTKTLTIPPEMVESILGAPKYEKEEYERGLRPGVGIGLAWTPYGGDVLYIETIAMPGEGKLTLSGQLGEVMKESATLAYNLIRSLGLSSPEWFKTHDIHVHIPAGAVPKDGPSAGVVLLAALASLITGNPLRPYLAMTGEITLRGRILPVGGIKEKILAAIRAGIREIALPLMNQKDVAEIPHELLEDITIHYFESIPPLLSYAVLDLQLPEPLQLTSLPSP